MPMEIVFYILWQAILTSPHAKLSEHGELLDFSLVSLPTGTSLTITHEDENEMIHIESLFRRLPHFAPSSVVIC